MFDVFKVFRVFGILPYRIVHGKLVLCPKWRIYSFLLGVLVVLITFYRGCIYIQNTDFVDILSVSTILHYIYQWEPMFLFIQVFVIFYTTIFSKRNTEKSIKLLSLLSGLSSRKTRAGNKTVGFTCIFLLVLLILVVVYHYLNIEHYPSVTWLNMIDYLTGYVSTAIITIQILQFCVFFEGVLSAYAQFEYSIQEQIDGRKLFKVFVKTVKLRTIINKFEYIFYPSIIFMQLNCFIYCVLGFKGIYDIICQRYFSAFIAVILQIWISFYLPLIFYWMHLSDVTESKVSSAKQFLDHVKKF